MLTTAVNQEPDVFSVSTHYLWGQLRAPKPETDPDKVQRALRVVTQEFASDNRFEDSKQIQNLVSGVLSYLQFGFTSQANVTDKKLTLNLVIDNPPTGNRFTAIANSFFEIINSNSPSKNTWDMTYKSNSIKEHQLSFVRFDGDK